MHDSWKTLVVQALLEIPVSAPGKVGLLAWLRQYHRCLDLNGIENGSPLTLSRLILIWFSNNNNIHQLRDACIEAVRNLEQPSLRFQHPYLEFLVTGLLVVGAAVLIPKTATTFPTPSKDQSILIANLFPVSDLETQTVSLPSASDYLHAASLFVDPETSLRNQDGLYNQAWIQQQADHYYSLQVISASTSDSFIKFCTRFDLCEKSAIYQTEINGKPIYRLLYGLYPNNHQTQLALAKLPQNLRKLKPWARQIGQIKQELRQIAPK